MAKLHINTIASIIGVYRKMYLSKFNLLQFHSMPQHCFPTPSPTISLIMTENLIEIILILRAAQSHTVKVYIAIHVAIIVIFFPQNLYLTTTITSRQRDQ